MIPVPVSRALRTAKEPANRSSGAGTRFRHVRRTGLVGICVVGLGFAGGLSTASALPESPRHISNPRQPAGGAVTIELEELWRVGADADESAPVFGVITGLAFADDGSVYVVDQQLSQVSVFSPDGIFQRTVGREGEGPGDLRHPGRAYVSAAGELRVPNNFAERIERFAPTGEYIGAIRILEADGGIVPMFRDLRTAGDHVVALASYRENQGLVMAGARTEIRRIFAIDDEAREIARYHEVSFTSDDAHPVWSERPSILKRRWDVGRDGRVFVVTSFDDYEVTVFDQSGAVDYVISRDYDHRRRSEAEKQQVHDWANVNPNGNLPGTRFEIEEFDKDIMSLHCREDGMLWVLSSRGFRDRPAGSVGVFDVFDRDGNYVRKITLVGDADPDRDRLYFHGDRLYVLTCIKAAIATWVRGGKESAFSDACDGPMEVVCYRIARIDPVRSPGAPGEKRESQR